MKRLNYISLLVFLFTALNVYSSTVDTIPVRSAKMDKAIKTVIILPETYNEQKNFPVVYLLHGWSDNYSTWVKKVPALLTYSDEFGIIIVMPDGGYDSWYWDSPVDSKSQYETFVSGELVKYIDTHYKTVANKKGRSITGNSMGGQGALFLAIRHPDIFGAAGSLSGGVDITQFPKKWGMADKLGAYSVNRKRWKKHSVFNLVNNLKPGELQLIIDCGSDDFFYKVNINLHKKLLKKEIPHVFISRPGQHTWETWNLAIPFQLRFFNQYFQK